MHRVNIFWLLIAVIVAITQVCKTADTESRLYLTLIGRDGYNRHVRPVKDHRRPVDVEVGLSLVEILGLDENTGRLTVKVWLSLSWKDEYLSWKPSDYGDIKRLNVDTSPSPRIWLPDMTVFNAIHSDLQSPSAATVPGEAGQLDGSSPPQAVVYADGTVRWVRPAVVSVTARHEFRANSWVATFRLGSWTYDDARVRLRPRNIAAGTTKATETSFGAGNNVPPVDFDVVNYSAGDHWTLVEHSGRRVETSTASSATALSNVRGTNRRSDATSPKNDDCCTLKSDVFVTFNYGIKLRKKIGPSLLASG